MSSEGGAARAEVESLLEGLAETIAPAPTGSRTGSAVVYSDGASRGNPGAAAIGVRILADDGTELLAKGLCIGKTTNNVAEYRAVLAGLESARELGLRSLELRLDSELVVRQIRGEYRVRQPALAVLKNKVDGLLVSFDSVEVRHIPRKENAEADRLANRALDRAAKAAKSGN
ncbi:MAG: ribonuclease H [Gemmatimonadetes bacterium]|jgi:ribonuclease HI|nr:ribonuclease H [Gemmatimonadota bacterium]